MPHRSSVFGRRPLALGFVAVTIAVVVLLVLQFVWLRRLQEMTAIAHHASLENTLRSIGTEVEFYYRGLAERFLAVPAPLFEDPEVEIAQFWRDLPAEGVQRLFVVSYEDNLYGHFLMQEEGSDVLVPVLANEEGLAIVVAVSPLQMLFARGGAQERAELTVTERDPAHRILVRPILGAKRAVVGAAGMVLDADYLRDTLLPRIVEEHLQESIPGGLGATTAITVRDENGEVVYASGEPSSGKIGETATETSALIPFVFHDWTLTLSGPPQGPQQLAFAGFAFNMTLAVLLAVALMTGLYLAMRAASRAMDLSDLKSEFVSNVSHELRTPLASIRTFGELLRLGRASSGERVQQYGELIETESRRLTRLVDNILDFSRIESGAKEYEFAPGDLTAVAEQIVASFRRRLKDRGFEFEWRPSSVALPSVEMDEGAVGQVLYNLVDNAVKYSGDSRRVRISVRREGDAAVAAVQDWGVGIPSSEQQRVFERFHRVGSGLVHDVKGSGLGLAIVQHVVRAHGGTVEVESQVEKGTTISVRLPLTREAGALSDRPAEGDTKPADAEPREA